MGGRRRILTAQNNYDIETMKIHIIVGLFVILALVIGVILAIVFTNSNDPANDSANVPAFTVSLSGITGETTGTTLANAASATKVNDLTNLGITPYPNVFKLSNSLFPNKGENWLMGGSRYSNLYANPSIPSSYNIKVHEIGFCNHIGTLTDSKVTLDGKVPIFNMSEGEDIDIGNGKSYGLSTPGVMRPTNGTYKFAYIIMSSTFTYQTNLDVEFVTDSADPISWNGDKFYTGIREDFIGKKTYFTGNTTDINYWDKSDSNGKNSDNIYNWLGNHYNPILDSDSLPSYATAAQFPITTDKTKMVQAYLALDNDLNPTTATYELTGGNSAPYAKYIIGVVELNTAITINNTTIQNVNCNIDTACLRMMAMAGLDCQIVDDSLESESETCTQVLKVLHQLGPFAMSFTNT